MFETFKTKTYFRLKNITLSCRKSKFAGPFFKVFTGMTTFFQINLKQFCDWNPKTLFMLFSLLFNFLKKHSTKKIYATCLGSLTDLPFIKVSKFRNVFLVSSILPKNELENLNFCPCLLWQKFFVCFLKELKIPKISFEINLPLARL